MLLQSKNALVILPGLILFFITSPAVAQVFIARNDSKNFYISTTLSQPPEAKGAIDIPTSKQNISEQNWIDMIGRFLDNYFQARYGQNAKRICQNPPTEFLEKVRGFVTGNDCYWEQTRICIDHIEVANSKLRFECHVSGIYLRLKTYSMTMERLAEGTDLKKAYGPQIDNQCICLVDTLEKYLLKY